MIWNSLIFFCALSGRSKEGLCKAFGFVMYPKVIIKLFSSLVGFVFLIDSAVECNPFIITYISAL